MGVYRLNLRPFVYATIAALDVIAGVIGSRNGTRQGTRCESGTVPPL